MAQDSVAVKQEPEWQNCADEWGVSEAATELGLYADHQVKDELVVGPELLQPPDATFAFCVHNNTLKSSKQDLPPHIHTNIKNVDNTQSGSERQSTDTHTDRPVLKDCFVKLDRIHKAPIGPLRSTKDHTVKGERSGGDTSRTHREESESISGDDSGFSESNHSAESRLPMSDTDTEPAYAPITDDKTGHTHTRLTHSQLTKKLPSSMAQDSVAVKQEPEWQNCADEWGVSEAATELGLYADHQVKDELVVGPELLQPPDATFAFCVHNNTLKSSKQDLPPHIHTNIKNVDNTQSGSERQSTDTHTDRPVLKDCFVKLDRIHKAPIGPLRSTKDHTVKGERSGGDTSRTHREESESISGDDSGFSESNHSAESRLPMSDTDTEPAYAPITASHQSLLSASSNSGGVGFRLRSCEVRLERILLEASKWPRRPRTGVHTPATDTTIHPSKERRPARETVSRQKKKKGFVKTGTDLQLNIYTCYSCGRTYKDKNNLIRHLQTHLSEKLTNKLKPYACDLCGIRFAMKVSLNSHKWKHTGTKPYACEICDVQFSRLDSLRYHERHHGGIKRYSCETCDKKFAHLSNLKRHERFHTGEKPFLCEVCKKQFRLSTALISHMATHARNKLYSCEICQIKFVHFTSYSRHKQSHTGKKRFSCDFCEKQFARLEAVKIHERIHTGERPYCCQICNRQFKQSYDLTAHSRIHTGEKPYSCDICKKQFARSGGLKTHKRSHTNEKPYACHTCEKVFAQLGSLIAHRRSHTGEKPYQCDVCKNRFPRSSALVTHKRLHTGEKPFSCKTCKKRFVQKGQLLRHNRIHTGES